MDSKHGEVNVTTSPSINTNVSLMNGETIALGGLINSTQGNVRSFIPILGSIPLLGYLISCGMASQGREMKTPAAKVEK